MLNWFVQMFSQVETNIVAAERIKEYEEIPPVSQFKLLKYILIISIKWVNYFIKYFRKLRGKFLPA
jgi:hypothetical protein